MLRIECGEGKYAIGTGNLEGKPCLTVCSDGRGVVGERWTRDNPKIDKDIEVFSVSFDNIESVDVWLTMITKLKEDFIALSQLRGE